MNYFHTSKTQQIKGRKGQICGCVQAFYQNVSDADSERLQDDVGDQLLKIAEEIEHQ